jgi:hypothetical protein
LVELSHLSLEAMAMRTRSRIGLLVLLLGGAAALVLARQRGASTAHTDTAADTAADTVALGDTVMIDGETPSCGECSLEATRIAVLGTPTDPEIPQRVPTVLRDNRGTHYLVFNGWIDKPILRYDSTGKYLGRLGGYGRGPGEYVMTHTVILGPGDSLLVYDWDRHFQIFDPEGRFRRPIRVARGTPVGVIPGTDGLLYAVAERWSKSQSPPIVLVIDGQGEVADSFPIFDLNFGSLARPIVAPDGSLWTFTDGNYRLERFARDGTVQQLIGVIAPPARRPPVMTAREVDSLQNLLRSRPSVRIENARADGLLVGNRSAPRSRTHMLVDSTGLLWVVRNIPAPRWDTIPITPLHLSPDEAPGETTIPREQEDLMQNAVVEVIDPRRARLLARTTLPFTGMLAAPGYVARVTADDDGHYRTEMYRVALRRGQPPR